MQQQNKYHTPPSNTPSISGATDLDDKLVSKRLNFQQSNQLSLTVHKQLNQSEKDQSSTAKKKVPLQTDKRRHRFPMRHVVVYNYNLPTDTILLILAIVLAGVVLYNDYQGKVAKIEADLLQKQRRCQYNYTVNMCEDRSLRAQREFCLSQKFCIERNVTEEVVRTVRASGIVAEVFKDFLDGMGIYSIAFIVIVALAFFLKRRDTKGFGFVQRISATQYCKCCDEFDKGDD